MIAELPDLPWTNNVKHTQCSELEVYDRCTKERKDQLNAQKMGVGPEKLFAWQREMEDQFVLKLSKIPAKRYRYGLETAEAEAFVLERRRKKRFHTLVHASKATRANIGSANLPLGGNLGRKEVSLPTEAPMTFPAVQVELPNTSIPFALIPRQEQPASTSSGSVPSTVPLGRERGAYWNQRPFGDDDDWFRLQAARAPIRRRVVFDYRLQDLKEEIQDCK
ncbi:hypothetical protein VKT23_020519 [Stygiomarasmius scandens]|uniref:Uncharacterized protein n=1 Tax=Marasmiellus scandens TaxID=2682957 RepID=A0ABR1ILE2_9AGAR